MLAQRSVGVAQSQHAQFNLSGSAAQAPLGHTRSLQVAH
jgi:hypothetical protein